MEHHLFSELSLILVIAGTMSAFMKLLKQPLIMGHIFTGLLLGPYFLNIINDPEIIEEMATFGITLLLFIIGLGLNPRVIKEIGKSAVTIGLGQVLFTAVFGYLLSNSLGFTNQESFYISIALTMSSTIIALKIISDKRDNLQLYAKLTTGILLVQDIVATVLLIVVAGLGSGSLPLPQLSITLGFAILLGVGVYLAGTVLLPRFEKFISDSQEFLFLFSIGWGFGVASLFALAGLSIEVGALFAGVALAAQPYAQQVGSRLKPLRDFFIIIFFIVLGVGLEFTNPGALFVPGIILALFVLIGNPLIIMMIMGLLGYTKKTSFRTGLNLAQISEFSLVLILLALEQGQISQDIVSVVTIVGLVTIAGSTYMMLYDSKLYEILETRLTLFERRKVKMKQSSLETPAPILLIGYDRGGQEFVKSFKRLKKDFLIVDYDPEIIDTLRGHKLPHAFGDVTDAEFLEELNLDSVKLVISTLTDFHSNLLVAQHIKNINSRAIVIVRSETVEEAAELYEAGATYVMMHHYIGSERVSHMVSKAGLKKGDFVAAKEKHLRYVQKHLTH